MMTGDTFSIGGSGAHGDLAGGAAGALLEAEEGGFSTGPFCCCVDVLVSCCFPALPPSLSTMAFGPTELENCEVSIFEG
jgi:hypothetical protein